MPVICLLFGISLFYNQLFAVLTFYCVRFSVPNREFSVFVPDFAGTRELTREEKKGIDTEFIAPKLHTFA